MDKYNKWGLVNLYNPKLGNMKEKKKRKRKKKNITLNLVIKFNRFTMFTTESNTTWFQNFRYKVIWDSTVLVVDEMKCFATRCLSCDDS